MVRTLSFHLSNAGSSPANLNIIQFNNVLYNYLNLTLNTNFIFYKFQFISYISPQFWFSYKLFLNFNFINKSHNKLYLKTSYLVLLWFYYFLIFNEKKNTYFFNKNLKLKFACLPLRKKLWTLSKSPMAHKKKSKEQFTYYFYKLNIYFLVNNVNFRTIYNINYLMKFIFLLKKDFYFFETNLLLLKYFFYNFNYINLNYFNYLYFINN